MKTTFRATVLLAVFLQLWPSSVHAQRKAGKPLQVGVLLGASNYMGDLAKTAAVMKETHPAGGLICRYDLNYMFTLRGSALFGTISGADANYTGRDIGRETRNLSFRSSVVEFGGQLEWNIFGYESDRNSMANSPYLFAGLAVYKFNPKAYFEYDPAIFTTGPNAIDPNGTLAQFDKKWVELQPLGTEGQETTKYNDKKRYSLTQISIPIGIGYKAQLDDDWALGIELGLRKTFTDYLDDVSTEYVDDQIVGGAYGYLAVAMKDRAREVGKPSAMNNQKRGNEDLKDWYIFGGITLTRPIVGGKKGCFNF
jgi:hypothetical protein